VSHRRSPINIAAVMAFTVGMLASLIGGLVAHASRPELTQMQALFELWHWWALTFVFATLVWGALRWGDPY
jgi:cytosine/uracil/thiamine/allantoin permease